MRTKEFNAYKANIPSAVAALYKQPPILEGEDPAEFFELAEVLGRENGASTTMQWMWVMKLAGLWWEHTRLLRYKSGLGELKRAGLTSQAETKKVAQEFLDKEYAKIKDMRSQMLDQIARLIVGTDGKAEAASKKRPTAAEEMGVYEKAEAAQIKEVEKQAGQRESMSSLLAELERQRNPIVIFQDTADEREKFEQREDKVSLAIRSHLRERDLWFSTAANALAEPATNIIEGEIISPKTTRRR